MKKLKELLCRLLGHKWTRFGVEGTITLGSKKATSQKKIDSMSYQECDRCGLRRKVKGLFKVYKHFKVK